MNDMIGKQLSLDSCAAEPIRIPGAIQPHGALLVLDPDSLTRRNASANLEEVIGLSLKDGEPLSDVGDTAPLVAELRRWLSSEDATFLRTLYVGRFVYQVAGHRTPQGLVVEFEDPPHSDSETLEGLYPRLRTFLESIAHASDVSSIAQAAVREVRALTGFNRVMLYAFDGKDDGTVLAEDGDGVLPSYLNQRFPASDIPAQARELYRLNRVRLIPNASYTPCPIEPATSPVDGQSLDLSGAALRSVSPVHLEYMRNMGTGSSMSISLLIQGKLWGLISGHSAAPRRVNAQVRTACDILGQILSLQIEAREQASQSSQQLYLKHIETELVSRLAPSASFQAGLVENGERWMALTAAGGAAVVTGGRVMSVGLTPPADQILAIVSRLQPGSEDVVALESLSDRWPEAQAYAEQASGMLAVSISQLYPDYILWFRPEVVRTIDWSGDPAKPMVAGADRLHPRKSFELWREQVRLRSLPWSAAEVESARSFRNAIQNLVLKRAEERAELTGQLERINKELESFSYSISHDLRAPFRHIVGYSELLAERASGLDEKSRHYLQSISDAALAAGRLVDDLLNFSQLGRASLNLGRVDMTKLVAEVRRALQHETEGRVIDWTVGSLPPGWGDSVMLRQVMQNLLENAIKYTSTRERAEISITGEERPEAVVYTVADNGVGFDMAYVGKLFGVFQRLHRAEEFEGTGIGLALAKRIVERHDGTISAFGALGEGASFTITLPKRVAAPKGDELRG